MKVSKNSFKKAAIICLATIAAIAADRSAAAHTRHQRAQITRLPGSVYYKINNDALECAEDTAYSEARGLPAREPATIVAGLLTSAKVMMLVDSHYVMLEDIHTMGRAVCETAVRRYRPKHGSNAVIAAAVKNVFFEGASLVPDFIRSCAETFNTPRAPVGKLPPGSHTLQLSQNGNRFVCPPIEVASAPDDKVVVEAQAVPHVRAVSRSRAIYKPRHAVVAAR